MLQILSFLKKGMHIVGTLYYCVLLLSTKIYYFFYIRKLSLAGTAAFQDTTYVEMIKRPSGISADDVVVWECIQNNITVLNIQIY